MTGQLKAYFDRLDDTAARMKVLTQSAEHNLWLASLQTAQEDAEMDLAALTLRICDGPELGDELGRLKLRAQYLRGRIDQVRADKTEAQRVIEAQSRVQQSFVDNIPAGRGSGERA